MCNAIYLAAIGLLLFYSDYVLGQYALTVNAVADAPMIVAVGWEMMAILWPVVLLGALLGSAGTLLATRRRRSCSPGTCSTHQP